MVSLLLLMVIAILAVAAARVDSRSFRLPNRFTAGIFVASSLLVAVWFAETSREIVPPLFAAWILLVSLHFGFAVAFRGALGMGDVKLIAGLGLPLVWWGTAWFWLLLAYSSGALWGIVGRRRGFSQRIAFGPHLAGGWIVVVVGQLGCVAMAYSR